MSSSEKQWNQTMGFCFWDCFGNLSWLINSTDWPLKLEVKWCSVPMVWDLIGFNRNCSWRLPCIGWSYDLQCLCFKLVMWTLTHHVVHSQIHCYEVRLWEWKHFDFGNISVVPRYRINDKNMKVSIFNDSFAWWVLRDSQSH